MASMQELADRAVRLPPEEGYTKELMGWSVAEIERLSTELDRYRRCLYRANGRLIQLGHEPEKLDYPKSGD